MRLNDTQLVLFKHILFFNLTTYTNHYIYTDLKMTKFYDRKMDLSGPMR